VANFVEIRSLSMYEITASREIRVNGQRTDGQTDRRTTRKHNAICLNIVGWA